MRSSNWKAILAYTLCLILAGCGAVPEDEPPTAIPEPGVPKQLQARQIIVALSERLQPQWTPIAQDLATQYRLQPVGKFPLTSIQVQCLVYQVPPDQPLEALVTRLQRDPRVELVQTNRLFEGQQAAPGDPYATLAYGVKLMRADQAHRLSTGRGVTVAVIDTGAETQHPDLQGQVRETATFVEGGEASFDTDRHGTAVAGVIAARADGSGLAGVAPDARLTVAKACWYPDSANAKALCSSWTLAKAIDFVINHGAKVLNLSLGGRASDELLARLLVAAEQRGMVVVAATLEGRDEPGFPASLETVIPVMACDANGRIRAPRWRGPSFVAAAPGIEVVAPIPHSRHTLVSGSSLAAAHVSGVVALLLQQTPDLTPRQIKTLLQATARPVANPPASADPVIGLVDACAALARHAPGLTCH